MSHPGYRHLCPVTPPASTLGETSPASQVSLERTGSRGFVGALLSVEPCLPMANTQVEELDYPCTILASYVTR
jgi:hypothetical protein